MGANNTRSTVMCALNVMMSNKTGFHLGSGCEAGGFDDKNTTSVYKGQNETSTDLVYLDESYPKCKFVLNSFKQHLMVIFADCQPNPVIIYETSIGPKWDFRSTKDILVFTILLSATKQPIFCLWPKGFIQIQLGHFGSLNPMLMICLVLTSGPILS